MDISKASNFERYVFELLDRDADTLRSYFSEQSFEIKRDRAGFVSGKSSHAERIATIKAVHLKYGVTIDPHTADGVRVGLQHREPGVPLICLETALPAKFADTIREALGQEPGRPQGFENLEARPQRYTVIEPDAEAVKLCIAANSG